MEQNKKFLDLEGLTTYDKKLKEYIQNSFDEYDNNVHKLLEWEDLGSKGGESTNG